VLESVLPQTAALSLNKTKRNAIIMKTKPTLLTLFICALAAANASATTYTVSCPPGWTAFALQVLPPGTFPPVTSAGVSAVIPGFNAGGDLDGSILMIPIYNINNPCPTGYSQVQADSASATGWSDPVTAASKPEPILTLGQGVYFNNQNPATTLTFSGSALIPAQEATLQPSVIQDHWYLRGRQVPSVGANAVTSWQNLMQSSPPAFPISIYPVDIVGGVIHFLPCQYGAPGPLATWDGVSSWTPPFPTLNVAGQVVWIGPPPPSTSATISGTVHQGNICASIVLLQNWTVVAYNTVTTVNYFGISDNISGNYSIQVPPGTYTVSSYSPPVGWNQLCGGPYPITAAAGAFYPNNNFTEKATVVGKDLAVDLVSFFPYPLRSPCCGQNMTYVISYRNAGTVPIAGVKVQLYYPSPAQTYVLGTDISVPPHSPGLLFGTRTWTIGLLPAHASGYIKFTVNLGAPCSLGMSIMAYALITPIAGDVQFNDNISILSQIVNCSHDPNDMQVDPQGCGPQGYIPAGQPLTYLIRFQNTGTGPASLVVISNLLSANLDVSTLQVLGSSHPNVLQVQGNQLVWTFPNINLPAQSTDDLGSQGYVKYRVSPLAADPVGAVITNNAAIYFDLNAPVLTVTTTNTITASPAPVASFTVTPVVGSAGQTNNFTYTGGSTGATYLWNFGPNATPATSTNQNPAGVVFTNQGDQMVTLQVSLGDCPSDPAVQIVTVGVPTLNAQLVDGQLVLSWQGNGYHLQERGDLQPGTSWSATTATVTQIDSDYATTLPLNSNAKYYRLSQVAP
jgi:uncharacterized repeat protein (TIGR01451 family)